jgi:hypothetical protein
MGTIFQVHMWGQFLDQSVEAPTEVPIGSLYDAFALSAARVMHRTLKIRNADFILLKCKDTNAYYVHPE